MYISRRSWGFSKGLCFNEVRSSKTCVLCILPKGLSFGRLQFFSVFYNKGVYFYMFLTATLLPTVWLLTLYGSIVHHQRKENAILAQPAAAPPSSRQCRKCRRPGARDVSCAVVTILFLACWLPVWIISFQVVFRLSQVSSNVLS